ncbi:MAG: hypothetical protein ACFCU1_09465 [Sumerlaeia bacterium]
MLKKSIEEDSGISNPQDYLYHLVQMEYEEHQRWEGLNHELDQAINAPRTDYVTFDPKELIEKAKALRNQG